MTEQEQEQLNNNKKSLMYKNHQGQSIHRIQKPNHMYKDLSFLSPRR